MLTIKEVEDLTLMLVYFGKVDCIGAARELVRDYRGEKKLWMDTFNAGRIASYVRWLLLNGILTGA